MLNLEKPSNFKILFLFFIEKCSDFWKIDSSRRLWPLAVLIIDPLLAMVSLFTSKLLMRLYIVSRKYICYQRSVCSLKRAVYLNRSGISNEFCAWKSKLNKSEIKCKNSRKERWIRWTALSSAEHYHWREEESQLVILCLGVEFKQFSPSEYLSFDCSFFRMRRNYQ